MFDKFTCQLLAIALITWTLPGVHLFAVAQERGQSSISGLPDPPEEFAELIKAGNVEFLFYDERPLDQQFDGETHFKFDVKYRFQFRVRRVNNQTAFINRATIVYTSIRIAPVNEIRLPSKYRHKQIWTEPLVVHEFEHVKINADPRIELLLRKLVTEVKTFEFKAARGDRISRTELAKLVDKAVQERIDTLTKLVQSNNDLLDDITRHGVISDSKDPNFFNRLFTEQNLEEQNFPFMDSMKTLLKSRKYRAFSKQTLQVNRPQFSSQLLVEKPS